jgi:hypothetical protein
MPAASRKAIHRLRCQDLLRRARVKIESATCKQSKRHDRTTVETLVACTANVDDTRLDVLRRC